MSRRARAYLWTAFFWFGVTIGILALILITLGMIAFVVYLLSMIGSM